MERRKAALFFLLAGTGLSSVSVRAAQFGVTKSSDSVVDGRAMTLLSTAPYGRGVNGEAFETDTITTLGGYQYASYWVNNAGSYFVAVGRRAVGSGTWEHVDLPASNWVNGGSPPSD